MKFCSSPTTGFNCNLLYPRTTWTALAEQQETVLKSLQRYLALLRTATMTISRELVNPRLFAIPSLVVVRT